MEDRKREQSQAAALAAVKQTDEDFIDFAELMYRLLAHWKMIVCFGLVCAIIFGVYTVCFVTPLYRATSTIYVLSQRDSAINISDLELGSELTGDYARVFRMWEVHEQVISNLDLPYTYEEMDGMLYIANEEDTRMLDINVTSASPEEAAMIANEYAKVASKYIKDNMFMEQPSIMSVARVPTYHVYPNKTGSIFLGLIVGWILSAVIIIWRWLKDDTYKTAEDIRRYAGLATLAVIPVDGNSDKLQHNGRSEAGRT